MVADAESAGPISGIASPQRLLLLTVPDLLLTCALVDAVLRRSRVQEEELDGAVAQREAVIALLARLIAKAAAAASEENGHDRIR